MDAHAGAPLGRLGRRPSGEPPPLPRQLNRGAIAWVAAFMFWAIIWVWVFLSDAPAIWITERDLDLMHPIVDHRIDALDPTMRLINRIGTHWATPVVGWTAIIGALLARRVRHAMITVASLSLVAGAVTMVATQIGRPRPLGITRIGDWEGFAQPSRPLALLATVSMAAILSLVPRVSRRPYFLATATLLSVLGFAQVYTGVDHPTDVMAGATVGVAIALVMFRTVAPEAAFPITYGTRTSAHLDVGGDRGEAIREGLRDQLGVHMRAATPFSLRSSAGSTPLRIDSADGATYFGKLYARSHLRSDRSYKLGRTLLYGRLEDEQHFTSVRRLVQHEDYMFHLMRRAGIPTPEPIGIVEITPDREYLLITEFLDGAVDITDGAITESIIDQSLLIVEQLWNAGLAHRDVKPANVMVQDGVVRLVDLSFAQVRPSPWRQAVDLANMMLVLALGSTPELVYERACDHFAPDEIAEAFAASRSVTLPSQLRRDLRCDGRDLLDRFRELAPSRPSVAVQRWSMRRAGLTMWMVAATAAAAVIFISNLHDIGLR